MSKESELTIWCRGSVTVNGNGAHSVISLAGMTTTSLTVIRSSAGTVTLNRCTTPDVGGESEENQPGRTLRHGPGTK
jgi:hypothetical protein